MENVKVFSDQNELTNAAALHAVEILRRAIAENGSAVWVLAGGRIPEIAYPIVASRLRDEVDWSRVTFVMGDERIVPIDSPDSNWRMVHDLLLQHVPRATFLQPATDKGAESGAGEYEKLIDSLPKTADGFPRFDLVWLGMGEDGHTLSLFPGHPDFTPTDRLVIPVHNSPKPPADRMSLTLTALGGAQHAVIMVAGEAKAAVFKSALSPASDLPVAQAARITHATWYVDKAASHLLA